MNVLAIHTATPEICVAAEGDAGSFLIAFRGKKQQAEEILPFMETAASNAGFTLKETQLVTAPEGPGAFTGLRLAYSAAKAVQFSSGCPFIPVPTLTACAENLKHCSPPVLCVMDAKKKHFYAQFFKSASPLSPVMDISPEEIAEKIFEETVLADQNQDAVTKEIILTGPDAEILASEPLFTETIQKYSSGHGKINLCVIPTLNGAVFSLISLSKQMLPHYNTSGSFGAGPMYIRRSDAEIFRGYQYRG